MFSKIHPFHLTFFIFYFLFIFSVPSFAEQTLIVEPDMGREPILQAIEHAKSSVDLVMYGLTDLSFVDALQQAKNQGKSIRVLLQHYPYKADDENLNAIKQLRADKIDLVWPDGDFKLTHQKTFLLDQQTAVVMTFNLTHSTFKNERNFALIIKNEPLVNEIQHVFDADWQHKTVQPLESNLIWSPDNSRGKLLAFIKSAKSSIKIYAEGLSDYEVVGALASAARKGVQVKILTSPPRNDDRPSKKWEYLKKAGVVIGYDKEYIIHAKVIIVDEEKAVLGSINLTRASINDNRELAVETREDRIVKQLLNVFEQDWQQSGMLKEKEPVVTNLNTQKTTMDAVSVALLQSITKLNRLVKTERSYHRKHRKRHRVAANAYSRELY